MERDDDRSGGGAAGKLEFDRPDIVETFVDEPLASDDGRSATNLADYLRPLIHKQVLSAAVERLEARDALKQIIDTRTDVLADIVAAHVTDQAILPDDELINQLIAMTGDLRGGFEVLERVAQDLGRSWEEDAKNFMEVTIGMSRLQILMRKLVERYTQYNALSFVGTAIIAVPAGEEHTFGQCMLDEILRAHGWRTVMVNPETPGELAKTAKEEEANLVCISWLSSHLEEAVKKDISILQVMPLNERPILIAGGMASHIKDKWMVSHGVDHVCDNAYAATEVASQLVDIFENNAQIARGRSVSEQFGRRV